ncbi:MAG: hypothetical protein V4662_26535 [Verrucomicrobiota bacterium]
MKYLGFALSFALLLSSCLSTPEGYVSRSGADINPHVHTDLNYPEQVGYFYRRGAWEREDDQYHLRVTYGYRHETKTPEFITVETSRLTPMRTLQAKQHHFVHMHPDAIQSLSAARAAQRHFPGWNITVFDYQQDVPQFPKDQRYQPLRTLMATKTFHGRTALIEATCLYDSWSAGFLFDASQFANCIFPHASSWEGYSERSYIHEHRQGPGK